MLALADFDAPTRSASGFLIRYILPRMEPPQLVGLLDRKQPFTKLTFGDLIIGMGHGGEDTFTGQNEVTLLEVGKYDPKLVKGKFVKLLSCECGQKLGPDLIDNGAVSFQGYTEDFLWVMDLDYLSRPWADQLAAKALLPVICSMQLILDGKTNQESFNAELEGFTINAEIEEDELIKSCLEFDRDNAIMLGDGDSKVRKRPPIPLPFKLIPPPPLPPTMILPPWA